MKKFEKFLKEVIESPEWREMNEKIRFEQNETCSCDDSKQFEKFLKEVVESSKSLSESTSLFSYWIKSYCRFLTYLSISLLLIFAALLLERLC